MEKIECRICHELKLENDFRVDNRVQKDKGSVCKDCSARISAKTRGKAVKQKRKIDKKFLVRGNITYSGSGSSMTGTLHE